MRTSRKKKKEKKKKKKGHDVLPILVFLDDEKHFTIIIMIHAFLMP